MGTINFNQIIDFAIEEEQSAARLYTETTEKVESPAEPQVDQTDEKEGDAGEKQASKVISFADLKKD